MATKAAVFAVKLIPGFGEFLSEALTSIDAFLAERKRIEDEVKELELSLATLAKKIEEVKRGHSSPSIQALEDAVHSFKAFVDAWKPPRKRDTVLHPFGSGSSAENDKFTSKYSEFEKTLNHVKLLITVEILQTIVQSHDDLRRKMDEHHEETTQNSNKNHQELTETLARMEVKIVGKGQLKVSREYQDALGAYKSCDGKVKDEAKLKLLALVGSGIDQDDAVDVSLAFIQDNDEELNTFGLQILMKMVADPELGRKLLTFSTLKVLLLALPSLSDIFEEKASSFLNDLMSLDPIQFLNNWDASECPITDERIIQRIIESAGDNEQALKALGKLATYKDLKGVNECKLVIAEMGGVEKMTRVYLNNEPFSRDGVNAVVSTKTLLAIDVLSSLAEDEVCRGKFAANHSVIWPLVHFVSNCAFLSTTNELFEYWISPVGDEYGIIEEGRVSFENRLVATTFGKNRRSTLQSEGNAGRALCTLSTDLRCRQAFLDLGNEIDLSSGKFTTKAEKPYHSLLGWLAMASWAAEDDMNTCNVESSGGAIASTDGHLFRVAWELLSQDIDIEKMESGNCDSHLRNSRYRTLNSTPSYPLLVRSIHGDLGSSPVCACLLKTCEHWVEKQDAIENFYIASLLLKMIAGSTSDSRSRVVELAAQSICALDDSNLEVFACYLLSKTTPADMTTNCIPLLVKYFQKIRYGHWWEFAPLSDMDINYEYIYASKCPVFPDDDRFDDCSKCLNRLAYHYLRDSKAQIEKHVHIVQQMRESKLIDGEE